LLLLLLNTWHVISRLHSFYTNWDWRLQHSTVCAHIFDSQHFSLFSILWLRFYPKVSLEPKPTTLHSLSPHFQTNGRENKKTKNNRTQLPHTKIRKSRAPYKAARTIFLLLLRRYYIEMYLALLAVIWEKKSSSEIKGGSYYWTNRAKFFGSDSRPRNGAVT
jgi:hypothetical protein